MDNQNQPQQPQYQPTPPPVQQPQYTAPVAPVEQHDPGKTLGIVGFIFAFVGIQGVGLILSILGFNKSKKAGFKNKLALAGIILNSLAILLALILIPVIFSITMASHAGITTRANSIANQTTAQAVAKETESYYLETNMYPMTFSELNDESVLTVSETPITEKPQYLSTIEFNACGNEGNKIGYWDEATSIVKYIYSGTASEMSSCTFSAI